MPKYEEQQLHAAIDAHIAKYMELLPPSTIFSANDADLMLGTQEFYHIDPEFSGFIPVDNYTHVAAALGVERPNPIPGYCEAAPMWQIRKELADRSETVHVIVPTYNEAENIERTLKDLARLPPEFGIVVLDSDSKDGTRALVEKFAEKTGRNIRAINTVKLLVELGIVKNQEQAGGKGTNIAVAGLFFREMSDILVFVDADHFGSKAAQVQALVSGMLWGQNSGERIDFTRAIMWRTTAAGADGGPPKPGERVTRLTAEPLLTATDSNPGAVTALSGLYAIRGKILNELSIPNRYGVETTFLYKIREERTAQVWCGKFHQTGKKQTDLEPMAHQVTGEALRMLLLSIIHKLHRGLGEYTSWEDLLGDIRSHGRNSGLERILGTKVGIERVIQILQEEIPFLPSFMRNQWFSVQHTAVGIDGNAMSPVHWTLLSREEVPIGTTRLPAGNSIPENILRHLDKIRQELGL